MEGYVLVVDDDNFISKVMTDSLRSAGLVGERAKDSGEAMEKIYSQPPELILLDVELPDKSGYEILRILRNDTRTSHVPIIIVTARDSVQDKVKGLESGADDYLVKPFVPEELVARVKSLLRRVKHEKAYNPLTGLPGNKLIQKELERVIGEREGKALIYIDIDNFKAYNDTYGFLRGDEVITMLADILKQSLSRFDAGGFLGHVGGDDFVMITEQEVAEELGQHIINRFVSVVPFTYDAQHRHDGYILAKDRNGEEKRFPLMTLSIAILKLGDFKLSLKEISLHAAKLKHQAKLKQENALLVKLLP